jgi:predicted RNase H-like nuclease (RuvC/YqgF family)
MINIKITEQYLSFLHEDALNDKMKRLRHQLLDLLHTHNRVHKNLTDPLHGDEIVPKNNNYLQDLMKKIKDKQLEISKLKAQMKKIKLVKTSKYAAIAGVGAAVGGSAYLINKKMKEKNKQDKV